MSPPDAAAEHYFVVGPSTVLEGACARDSERLELEASAAPGVLGRLRCDLRGQRAEITRVATAGDPAAEAEALRLFVRVAAKRFGARAGCLALAGGGWEPELVEHLRADGFAGARDEWVSTRLAFERPEAQRAGDMEGVYADPFTIPWNFVPVETDVLARLTAQVPAGGRVLDLGCGFGKNAQFLARRGYAVCGVDVAARAVERTRELLGQPERFLVAPAHALPWPDGAFDAVLDVGCLHCMDAADRPAALREAARVLRDGGVLCSRVFRPRPARWLAAQPFRTTAFGMEAGEAAALLGTAFGDVAVDATPDALYLTATAALR